MGNKKHKIPLNPRFVLKPCFYFSLTEPQNCEHHSQVKKKMKWGNFGWDFVSIFGRKNGENANAAAKDHQLERIEPDSIQNDEYSSSIPPDSPFLLQQKKKAKAEKTIKMGSFSRFVVEKVFIKTKPANTTENNPNIGRIAMIGRSPSRTTTLKMAKSLTKKTNRRKPASQDEILNAYEREKSERELRGGEELCKKRILMGGKCKPLMGSILQYDKDGVLKPDISL